MYQPRRRRLVFANFRCFARAPLRRLAPISQTLLTRRSLSCYWLPPLLAPSTKARLCAILAQTRHCHTRFVCSGLRYSALIGLAGAGACAFGAVLSLTARLVWLAADLLFTHLTFAWLRCCCCCACARSGTCWNVFVACYCCLVASWLVCLRLPPVNALLILFTRVLSSGCSMLFLLILLLI